MEITYFFSWVQICISHSFDFKRLLSSNVNVIKNINVIKNSNLF